MSVLENALLNIGEFLESIPNKEERLEKMKELQENLKQEYIVLNKKETVQNLNEQRKIKMEDNGWVGSNVPFGYTHYKGNLYPNEHDKKILEDIYHLSKYMSKQQIYEELKANGVKRNNGRPVSRSTVYRVFYKQYIEIYLGIKYKTPLVEQGEELYSMLKVHYVGKHKVG